MPVPTRVLARHALRLLWPVLLAAGLVVASVGVAGAAGPPSTPELIDGARARGEITAEQRLIYLGYALFEPANLPAEYRGTKPWSGTPYVREVRDASRAIATSRFSAQAVAELSRFSQQLAALCDTPNGASSVDTTNFRFSYGTIAAGLTIGDYTAALEGAYATEVTGFGWPKPPVSAANVSGKYPVQITSLGTGTADALYGYVTASGGGLTEFLGDNPNTAAVETISWASCMVVNSDLSFAGSTVAERKTALEVTMAHEYFHAIQMGVADVEDTMWSESTAAYVENEFRVSSSDSLQYLPPRYRECLTNYPSGAENVQYSNWVLFAFASQQNGGLATAGGGENVIQAWLANVAQGQSPTAAYANALTTKGTTLDATFHNYAIAVRFPKSCPTGGAYCLSRGAEIADRSGPVADDGAVADVGLSYSGSVKDSYAINWVGLPTTGRYAVTLRNSSSGGALRASVVADLGGSVQVTALPTTVGAGASAALTYSPPAGAQSVVLVITNQQLNASPTTCASHAYQVTLGQAGGTPSPTSTPIATATPVVTATPGTGVPSLLPTAIPGGARIHAPLVPRNAALGAIPGSFKSSIVVANPGTTDANVRLTFVTELGAPALASPVQFTVRPGASRTQFVPGVAGLADGLYATLVDADQPVVAVVNLGSEGPSTSASFNGVGSADTGTTFYVPSVYRNYFGFSSNIVVQNAGSVAATVLVTYKRPGATDVTESHAVPAGAAYIFEQATATGLTDGFIGSAVVSADQPIAAIFNVSSSGQLSSSNGVKTGAPSVALPVIYNGYFGYNTSVLVQNVDSAAASVRVRYYSSSTGQVVGEEAATVQPGASQLFLQFASGDRPSAVPSGFNGSALVSSTEGRALVAVTNVQASDQGYLSAYNGFAAGSAVARTSCPAILKNYFGFSTSLTVQNADSTPTSLTLTYVDSTGVTVDTVQVASLQPGATYFSYTPANANLAEGFAGAVVVQSAGAKIVAVVNELLGTGGAGDQLFTYNCFSG